ncbi:PilN domain-containing protein [Gracilimonas sp. Q87]|uniref:PilN domain-containing protein n=1 Tax=Gracilimonas sp. Q87 TaxID=3384766 RepID=UPI0039840068
MFQNKTYTGIVVEGDSLKVAKLKVAGKKLELVSLDQVRLIEPLKTRKSLQKQKAEPVFEDLEMDQDLDDEELIFGLDSDEDEDEDDGLDLENLDDDLNDLDFEDLDDTSEQVIDTDMVDEAGAPASNELLLYNLLSSISSDRVDLGISIPAGQTIFQILKDTDFSDTKKKDLQVIVDDRLEALHGVPKGEDFYSYTVRDDGALLLTSIDDEPQLLTLLNRTQDLYRGKLFINQVLPEEILLLGLIRANYELEENSISGVVQFGEEFCRVIFLRGDQLWIVSPIITEGVNSKKFLNTVFSKILFQLDTGEVPNLDRLIICNNSLGDSAIEFFEERFQDVDVSEFHYQEDFLDTENINESTISSFTTAIGAAWAASGHRSDVLPNISFLPKYVDDRQKIFKLQWHGFLLLFLILITPMVANYFITQNASEIDRLEGNISTLEAQIRSLESTVQRSNEITNELGQIQSKLALLSELNQGTLRWSTNLDQLNSGVSDINSLWITAMRQNQNNSIELAGVARYRDRIPMLADLFNDATLLNVTTAEIRLEEVFEFRYVVESFFEDENIYTPENVQGIQEIIGE